MSKYVIDESTLTAIGDAIRSVNGEMGTYDPDLMPTKINQMKRYRWADSSWSYCVPKAQEAVYVARTYWTARAAGRAFKYTTSGKTFLNGGKLNDSNGAGIIDCSTYIHLVLRGIPYEKSPYASNLAANATYDPDNLVTNTAEYTWADDCIRDSKTIGGQVRYAAELAAYFWAQGRVFTDPDLRQPGDIIFHSTKDNDRFMSITHVSIVEEDTSQYFNVTDVANVVVRTAYASRNADIVFFARPDYERIAPTTYSYNPDFNYLCPPWMCTAAYTASGGVTVTPSAENCTVTTSSSGATAATEVTLISSSYPLFLPAGRYRLSGAPAYQDRRARLGYRYWGMRIYPLDGRSITAQVCAYSSASYSSPPTETLTETAAMVWDYGYGAEFEISTGMAFYASIYISKTPTSGVAYNTTDVWAPTLKRIG